MFDWLRKILGLPRRRPVPPSVQRGLEQANRGEIEPVNESFADNIKPYTRRHTAPPEPERPQRDNGMSDLTALLLLQAATTPPSPPDPPAEQFHGGEFGGAGAGRTYDDTPVSHTDTSSPIDSSSSYDSGSNSSYDSGGSCDSGSSYDSSGGDSFDSGSGGMCSE